MGPKQSPTSLQLFKKDKFLHVLFYKFHDNFMALSLKQSFSLVGGSTVEALHFLKSIFVGLSKICFQKNMLHCMLLHIKHESA